MNERPLSVRGLAKAFGQNRVLDGLDLEVSPGEIVALSGPNGAGKSTLLSCVVGNVIADAGTVTIGGMDLREHPLAARRALRHVPQEAEVLEGVTGRELLQAWADMFATDKLEAAVALTDLGESLDLLATTYSVGMRRRLQLGVIELGQPALLVLDEPFAGLDGASSQRVAARLAELAAGGCGVLLAAHDAELRALREAKIRRVELGSLSTR